MSFIDFKKDKYDNEHIRRVHSESIDEYFIDNYNFRYVDNFLNFGYSLSKLFKLDESSCMCVIISKDNIHFHKEYYDVCLYKESGCDDIVNNFTINLKEKFENENITAEKLEEIINEYF